MPTTLLLRLDGDERTRMPPDAPLPAADIDLVRTRIALGLVVAIVALAITVNPAGLK